MGWRLFFHSEIHRLILFTLDLTFAWFVKCMRFHLFVDYSSFDIGLFRTLLWIWCLNYYFSVSHFFLRTRSVQRFPHKERFFLFLWLWRVFVYYLSLYLFLTNWNLPVSDWRILHWLFLLDYRHFFGIIFLLYKRIFFLWSKFALFQGFFFLCGLSRSLGLHIIINAAIFLEFNFFIGSLSFYFHSFVFTVDNFFFFWFLIINLFAFICFTFLFQIGYFFLNLLILHFQSFLFFLFQLLLALD